MQSTLETQVTWLFGSLKENSDPFLDKENAFFREVRLQKLTIKEKIELYKERFGGESVSRESAFYRKIRKFEKRLPQEHDDFTIPQTYSSERKLSSCGGSLNLIHRTRTVPSRFAIYQGY